MVAIAWSNGAAGQLACAAVHDAGPVTGAVRTVGQAETVTFLVAALVGFQTVLQ